MVRKMGQIAMTGYVKLGGSVGKTRITPSGYCFVGHRRPVTKAENSKPNVAECPIQKEVPKRMP